MLKLDDFGGKNEQQLTKSGQSQVGYNYARFWVKKQDAELPDDLFKKLS